MDARRQSRVPAICEIAWKLEVAFVLHILLSSICEAQQCITVQYNTYRNGFRYALGLSLDSCQSSQLNVSRLVLQGACSNDANNNFGGYPKCSSGGSNLDTASSATCTTFFNASPESRIVRQPGSGNYDSGRICSGSDYAYVFVQSNCSSFSPSQLKLDTSSYGGFCFSGDSLSAGAIAGIAIGCAAVVFVIVFLGIRYGCRRTKSQPYSPGVSMQQLHRQNPPVPPSYGIQPVYGQAAPQQAFVTNHQPFYPQSQPPTTGY